MSTNWSGLSAMKVTTTPDDEELKCKPAFVISEWDHDINYYVDEIEWWTPAPELPEGINGRSE
jgi:hypothetical protein